MITHMGDTSNLILDPDLDSYYLMDVTLLAVPQLMDRLQDMAVYVQSLPDAGRLDEAQKIKLAGYASWLKDADLERIFHRDQIVDFDRLDRVPDAESRDALTAGIRSVNHFGHSGDTSVPYHGPTGVRQ